MAVSPMPAMRRTPAGGPTPDILGVFAAVAERVEARLAQLTERERTRWAAVDADVAELFDVAGRPAAGAGQAAAARRSATGASSAPAAIPMIRRRSPGRRRGRVRAAPRLRPLPRRRDGRLGVRRGNRTCHLVHADRHDAADWTGEARRFGEGVAILVGDLAFVYADELMRLAPPAAWEMWNELRLELNVGQYLDILGTARRERRPSHRRAHRPLQVGQVHRRAAAARRRRCWPRPSGLTSWCRPLSAYGLPLGDAFQLRDDMLGAFGDEPVTGKPVGDDLREGKPTPLLALATARGHGDAAARPRSVSASRTSVSGDVVAIQDVLVDTGAVAELEQRIDGARRRGGGRPGGGADHRRRPALGLTELAYARRLAREVAGPGSAHGRGRTRWPPPGRRRARPAPRPRPPATAAASGRTRRTATTAPRTASAWRGRSWWRSRAGGRRATARPAPTDPAGPARRSTVIDRGRRRPDRRRRQARPVAEHRAPHQLGPGAGDEQRDVGAETAADHGGRPELGQRGVGVGHQHLGRVAAADGTVERPCPVKSRACTGPGHALGPVRHRRRRLLAETVEQQQRAGRRVGVAGEVVEGQRDRVVAQVGDRRDGSRQEVEDEVGDDGRAARCARSGRCRRAVTKPAVPRQPRAARRRVGCPSPSPRAPGRARRGRACRGPPSVAATTPAATGRSRRSASTGRASSASRRRPRGRRCWRCRAATRAAGAGSAARGAWPAPRACPACARRWRPGARWSSHASSSVASMRVRSWFGDVGRRPLRRAGRRG